MKSFIPIVLMCLSILGISSCKKSGNNKEETVRTMSELIQERDAKLKTGLQADEIIGSWKFTHFNIGGTVTIYRKDDQYFCYGVYSDGSKRTETLSKEGDEKYYTIRDGKRTTFHEYYLVTSDSLLKVCDDDGNIGWETSIALYPSI